MISSTAIFAVSDIEATLAHYKGVLGFETSWTWGEPPTFGSASFGGVTVMFSLQPELAARVGGHEHWIKVKDADSMYELHRASGANIISAIENKPWGSREYGVKDLNGYVLRIAGPPVHQAPSSEPFPDGVSIEARKPTLEEFALVAGSVFNYSGLTEQDCCMVGDAVARIFQATWTGKDPGTMLINYLRREPERFCRTATPGYYALVEWQLPDAKPVSGERKATEAKKRTTRSKAVTKKATPKRKTRRTTK